MIIIPAIDLKDGKCVRLLKGEEGTETVFSTNPVETAKKWENCGAKWIHVVDLDGAFEGSAVNSEIILDIVKNVSCDVQLGGGIRDVETADRYISGGVKRLIIGTKAFSDPDFVNELCDKYPGKISVGLDTKNNRIAVKGWKEVLNLDMNEAIRKLEESGASMFVHTNVDKDGTMEGVNTGPVKDFIANCSVPVIASGGIATMEDLEKLSALTGDGLYGVILGKSIYSGSIDLEEAVKRYR